MDPGYEKKINFVLDKFFVGRKFAPTVCCTEDIFKGRIESCK